MNDERTYQCQHCWETFQDILGEMAEGWYCPDCNEWNAKGDTFPGDDHSSPIRSINSP